MIGPQRIAEFANRAASTLVGLDFDGVLSPIVDDPTNAKIHPRGPAVLAELSTQVAAVAIITGRPARQAIALGDLDTLGEQLEAAGQRLRVAGQYGNERWDSAERRVLSPKPPQGLATFMSRLPALLRRHGAPEAYVEDKGLAVGIHTRRLTEPQAAFERLLEPIAAAAGELGLQVEPGRLVIEVRASGMDKGQALESLIEQTHADAVIYCGDDLGDVAAFTAARRLRDASDGRFQAMLVAVGPDVPDPLAELSDLVVAGPDGVMDFLVDFTAAARLASRT